MPAIAVASVSGATQPQSLAFMMAVTMQIMPGVRQASPSQSIFSSGWRGVSWTVRQATRKPTMTTGTLT